MLHILQLSDTHLFADPQGALYDVNTRDTLSRVIEHIQNACNDVDAILLTGDLVHDESLQGYQVLQSMISSLDCPTYSLPGNHDDPSTMIKVMQNCACENSLVSFSNRNWSIVLLDSSTRGKVEGELSKDTLSNLKTFLENNADKFVLVALHHHIIDVHSPWLDALNLQNHAQLTALLENFANVKVVINGHVHQEIDHQKNGIRYLGTPATCFQFKVRSHNGGADDRPPAFRQIILKEDGTLDTTVHYVR